MINANQVLFHTSQVIHPLLREKIRAAKNYLYRPREEYAANILFLTFFDFAISGGRSTGLAASKEADKGNGETRGETKA